MRYNEFTRQNIAEGSGNVGQRIKALYQQIYSAGDDAVEFAHYDSPIFAQYWDEYEGDLDSIIAEVDPSELEIIVSELESAVEDQGLAEGMLDNPGRQDSPVAQAIIRRILMQRTDLLGKFGPERVMQAIDSVADFVGDVDEIGSSDVSGWIRQVEQELGSHGVAEGPGFDKWADERAAAQLHKLKKPHPETWHDVDKKLGRAVDKMSQAEKVKKGLAHPDTLKKQGVAEGSSTTWEVSYDYGPHMTKTVTVKAGSESEARARVEKAAEKKGMSIMINSVEPANQGVAEGSDPNTQSHADAFKSETDTMRPGTKKYVGRKGGKEVTAVKDAQGNVKFYHRDGIKGPLKRVAEAGYSRATGRASWDSNMPGYRGDYGGEANWGRRNREDDEHHEIDRRIEQEREYQVRHGTWYVRVDGQVIPGKYQGKAAANAAALEFKKQPGNENKVIMLTMKEQ